MRRRPFFIFGINFFHFKHPFFHGGIPSVVNFGIVIRYRLNCNLVLFTNFSFNHEEFKN